MATLTAKECLYAFRYWIKNNPHKSIEAGMTWDDFDAMVDMFCTVNTTTGSLVTVANDPLSYGDDCDVPGKTAALKADGAGISFTTPSVAICNQSAYPDTHYGS